MALTVSQAGTATSTTSSSTLVITPTVSFNEYDVILVLVAADNSGTFGAISISSVEDSQSNTYTLVRSSAQQGQSVNNLATAAIYRCLTKNALSTSDSITVNFSPNTPAKAAVVWKVASASGYRAVQQSQNVVSPTSDGTSLSRSSGTMNANDAVFMLLGLEHNGSVTGDSDTTRGTWSAGYSAIADTGTATTSMQAFSQHKIVTSTGTQTWDVSFSSASYCGVYVTLRETIITTFTRTATGSGTGTEYAAAAANPSATDVTDFLFGFRATPGFYRGEDFATFTRTASGSGTGTESTAHVVVRIRTATGSGTGTQSATGVRVVVRTATGSGAGTESAAGVRVVQRTATGDGTGTDSSQRLIIRIATATGSGAGTEAASRLVVALRTATGSGTGSETTSVVCVRVRTATGSGASSESAIALEVLPRTATGSGQATTASVAVGLLTVIRAATGGGTGDQTAAFIRGLVRIATGSGAGTAETIGARLATATATGSGTGTSSTTTFKNLVFRTPSTTEIAPADRRDMSVSGRLFKHALPTYAGVNVYKLTDGSYTEIEQRDYTLVSKTYFGGTLNEVTQDEKNDLVAAGYGSYVS